MAKKIVFYNGYGEEVERLDIPECHLENGLDYKWCKFKWEQLNRKDPYKYECWKLWPTDFVEGQEESEQNRN